MYTHSVILVYIKVSTVRARLGGGLDSGGGGAEQNPCHPKRPSATWKSERHHELGREKEDEGGGQLQLGAGGARAAELCDAVNDDRLTD